MRTVKFGISLLAIIGICNACNPPMTEEMAKQEVSDPRSEVMSKLILYQYGQELGTWKALKPQATD